MRRARQKFTFPRCIPAPLPRSGSGGRSVRPPGRRRRAPELGGGGRWEGGRGRKQRKSSGFCCCRGWIAASGASSFSLPALQPSPRSGYNNVLLFGTLSVARTSAGTRGREDWGLKVEWARGSRRACSRRRLSRDSFCVFPSSEGSHVPWVPGRPSGAEEVCLWAREMLGLGSASSAIVLGAE